MRGDRLRNLREAANISQEDLALRLGISESQIWRYENTDTAPRSDVVVQLAEFFNVSTDYLLGLADSMGVDVPSTSLSPTESAILEALRRGDKIEAIRTIVGM